jgi:hypothetical protein
METTTDMVPDDTVMALDDPEMEAYLQHLAEDEEHTMAEQHQVSPPSTPDSEYSSKYAMTGRPPYVLYLSCDGRNSSDGTFSEYQQLLRKQIEVFEAGPEEVQAAAQGRNKPIVLGQVGIRCRHCAYVPPTSRTRGAVYFPSKLEGVYQMAQNMANTHLCASCPQIPQDIRAELIRMQGAKASMGGTGKSAWAERVGVLGVFEDSCGLRYKKTITD